MPENLPPLPMLPVPGRYRHYKGNEYEIIGMARHTETLEPLVAGSLPCALWRAGPVGASGSHVC